MKKKRGRDAHAPTDELRARVRELAPSADHEHIARAIGVSKPTLRKHYAAELADRLGPDNLFAASAEPAPAAPAPPKTDGRGKGGGRPRYEPDRETRERVMERLSVGLSAESLALGLKITLPTFTRAFREELRMHREVKQAEIVDHMFRAARKGNVPAQTRLLDMMERARLAELDEQVTARKSAGAAEADTPAPRKIETTAAGKKVQAELDAQRELLEGGWSDVLPQPGAAAPAPQGRLN